ncbi:M23 family metallopeptidase [Tamaricihabitans halophyticus]|uniref:M23 family metallopeptidase n=1 Tax=Tamaricihabitans halophyticus TaxID=1262583 RepID=UPI001FB43DBF|nr:M23 family metallopeptidase [Tamaricihabitans halophyticus]
MRGKVVVAAVAAGAFAAAAAGQTLTSDSDAKPGSHADVTPLANSNDANAAIGVGGDTAALAQPQVLSAVDSTSDASAEVKKLTETTRVTAERQAREAEAARKAAEEAARPKFVAPAVGTFTSGFGARWGTSHLGIDIANSIGTPIVSVTDGTVIEAGPASGFGNWVRIQMDDGTVLVYGHMATYNVTEGQRVKAGDQIAEIGNEGQSTGPHVHVEVWLPGGEKINPQPWLAERGVTL